MNKPLCILVAAVLGFAKFGFGQPARSDEAWRNFDTRRAHRAAGQDILESRRAAALAQLKTRIQDVQVDFGGLLGTVKFVRSTTRFLTESPPCSGDCPPSLPGLEVLPDPYWSDPDGALKHFLDNNAELFGHDSAVLASARKSREFVTAYNQARTVVWQQEVGGIPVFEAMMIANFARDGRLISVCSQLLPDPTRAMISRNLLITPVHAIALAARQVGEASADASEFVPGGDASSDERLQKFVGKPVIGEAKASLVWLPMDRTTLRLCWRVVLKGKRIEKLFQVLIDAETGEALVRHCWSAGAAEATYLVFDKGSPTPLPGWSTPLTNQPSPVAQTNITLTAWSMNASPAGWVNTNASLFWLTNTTFGNNVDVHLDWTNAPPAYGTNVYPPRPAGVLTNGRVKFTGSAFTADLTQSPTNSANANAAVVNVFYWLNRMHDVLYELGFTEPNGNFQFDNFGRGGETNDPADFASATTRSRGCRRRLSAGGRDSRLSPRFT